jgi:predicted DNA-binding transcriptional regulator AlpA
VSESQKRYLTAPELAVRWGVSRARAYKYGDDGILPVFRVGDNVRYPLDAVERFERQYETQADRPNG